MMNEELRMGKPENLPWRVGKPSVESYPTFHGELSNLPWRIFKQEKYGILQESRHSFPRHGIYIHKGAYKGYGGVIGSKWEKLKRIVTQYFDTMIIDATNIYIDK